jgi:YD repeat-containing protein
LRVSVVVPVIILLLGLPAQADTATYIYDAARGLLIEIDYGNGTKIVYAYDGAGNRTSVTVTCGSSGC